MRRILLLSLLLAVAARTARAEPGPPLPGLIGGPGLVPRLAGPPMVPVVRPPVREPPLGPFWRMPPVATPRQATGSPPPAGPGLRCHQAIAAAEAAEGIPPHLLQAIGVVESGRPTGAGTAMLPWPWTVDVAGRGAFYPDPAQAVAAVRAARAAGARSIDVGCLQVSLLHHPTAFASLAEAFDPVANARYAAGFLHRLYQHTHDWAAAAAAYHSQTPALAGPYRAKVLAAWTRLGGTTEQVAAVAAAGPFGPVTPLAIAAPRQVTEFRILRTGPMSGGRSLAAYRARAIPIDRGG